MKAHLEDLKGDYSKDVLFKEIDVSSDIVNARKYGIQTVPTVIIVDSATGDPIEAVVGPRDKQAYRDAINSAM